MEKQTPIVEAVISELKIYHIDDKVSKEYAEKYSHLENTKENIQYIVRIVFEQLGLTNSF